MKYFAIAPADLIVVHDLDLPFGQLKLKRGGGAGGHNGLKSITQSLGTQGLCPAALRYRPPAGAPRSHRFRALRLFIH